VTRGAPTPPPSIRLTLPRPPRASEPAIKTTRYFEEQVLRKRPYIERAWCAEVVANPLRREVQPDGRMRFWANVDAADGRRVLRVVTLDDGETIHNAFFDRNFRQAPP